jgi:tetratricopeptide (TPR) repeat protein
MARMHRAILDVDTALAFAGRALERDPEHAPALYERVVLLSMRHGHCLREDSEASRAEIVRLRAAILADCARLGGLDPTRELAARGLLAYHEGRFAEAEALLHRALGRDPHLEEAWETLALAASAQAWHAEGHEKGARWREAVDLFTKAIGQDRGYVPYWLGRATARLHRGAWADASGGDPSEDWAEAERDCAEALRLQPAWLEGRLTRGAVRSNRAARLARRGADPTGDWAGAEEDFGAILAAGEHATARMARAGTRMHRGVWRAQAGGDPVPDWAAAEEDYGTLEGAAAREARGNVRYNLAVHAERAGRDARAVWAAVAADYEEAIAIDPSRAGTLAERLAAARARR